MLIFGPYGIPVFLRLVNSHTSKGFRLLRESKKLAAGSPTTCSFSLSQVSFRFSRNEISAKCMGMVIFLT